MTDAMLLARRAFPFALALGIWFTPVPGGLTAPAWHLFAIFAGAIALMVVLHLLIPGPQWPTGPSRAVGALLVFAGIALNVVCAKLFEDRRTAIKPYEEPSKLVVDGPYRYTRNPMYVGMAGVLAAHALWRGPVAALPLLAWVTVIDRLQIRPEEASMRELFGGQYAAYRDTVPRWLGPVG